MTIFFCGLHLFLDRKGVTPRNPAPGATIPSNATAQNPETPLPTVQSGCGSESIRVFALVISMPCFESINFYQNKLKIKLFLQNNKNFLSAGGSNQTPKRPFSHCKFLVTCLMRDACCSYFRALESYNEKLLS